MLIQLSARGLVYHATLPGESRPSGGFISAAILVHNGTVGDNGTTVNMLVSMGGFEEVTCITGRNAARGGFVLPEPLVLTGLRFRRRCHLHRRCHSKIGFLQR